MRFGLGSVVDLPLREMAARAGLLEELGYDQLWLADERLTRNVYAALAVSALATERIGIGVGVTNPYTRHPAVTAAAIASIDEASNGRTILGWGAGGGLGHYGVQRERPAVAVREATEIVRALTAGECVDHIGRFFKLNQAELNFACPRQIPVYIAARGPRLLRLAGEIADGAIIGGFALQAGIDYALSLIQQGLDRSGRSRGDIEIVAWIYTSVADDADAARGAVTRLVASSLVTSRPILDQLGLALPPALRRHFESTEWSLAPEDVAVAAELLDDSVRDALSVAGRPGDCVSGLARVAAAGVDQLALVALPPQGSSVEMVARRLAAEVLPSVRDDGLREGARHEP